MTTPLTELLRRTFHRKEKMKKSQELNIGGQAVIEGVMMRSKNFYSVSVRRKSGEILNKIWQFIPLSKKNKFLKLPVLRGFGVLIDSFIIGYRSLNYSAEIFSEDMLEETTDEKENKKIKKENKNSKVLEKIVIVFSFIFGFALFFYFPLVLAKYTKKHIDFGQNIFFLHLYDGITKLLVFVTYIVLISFLKDVKRIFSYHGAEHKTIHAAELGQPLSVENIKAYDRRHIRCGTNFIFTVIVVGILFHSVIRTDIIFWNFILRIMMIPLISGISYELIKYAFKNEDLISKIIFFPGILFQNLTTSEPDDKMLEVAISAYTNVKSKEDSLLIQPENLMK